MNPGDPILWNDITNGLTYPGRYVATYGRWLIVEVAGPTGHLSLRYADPVDVRPYPPDSARG